jgi:hypothetical protein
MTSIGGFLLSRDALEQFKASMEIGHEQWHDGIGYDLDALDAMSPEELLQAEELVIRQQLADWRDVEALDRMGSGRALAELEKGLRGRSLEVRLAAARRLHERGRLAAATLDGILVAALDDAIAMNGLSRVLDLATEHPTPAVRQKLLWCTLHGAPELRVHAAALVHFLHGCAASEFDWDHRPFYLRFADASLEERRAAHRELCAQIGVEAEE